MDVEAHVLLKPISSPLLVLDYKRMKLELYLEEEKGELVEAKREVPLSGNTPGQNRLGKKILKKKERKIEREEGLQSKSSLFLLLFSYFSSFIMVVFLPSMS